jgi:hypothetical protein
MASDPQEGLGVGGVTHDLISHERREKGDWLTKCSCGAVWSQGDKGHPLVTQEHLDSIFKSHVAYAKRMATRVD